MMEYIPQTPVIKKEGIEGAQKLMKEELDEWKNVKISLAVVGYTGAGKSTFINAIRG
jgi:ribosome biogenesis GTPase A